MKKRIRYLTFSALFLLPLLFYPLFDKYGWISISDVHAMFEFASFLLSIIAGTMVLLYFFTSGSRLYLIISVGLFLIGIEELFHSIFSFTRLWGEMPSNYEIAISVTWISGQFVLAAFFFFGLFSGERIREETKKTQYALSFNNFEVGMFRTRLHSSEILEFNEKYLKILGYTLEEAKGIHFKDLWVKKHKWEKMVQQLKTDGQVLDLECELLTKEEKVIHCMTSLKLYRDTGIIEGTILDITDRKMAEKTLRKNEARLRDIIFSMGDWVWEVDENFFYTYSSRKASDPGSENENIVGKTPFDFMAPEEAKRVGEILSKIAAQKAPIKDLENWNIGKNGERIYLITNGIPIIDNEGNLKGYRGINRDITEFKKNEAALKRMNELMISLNQRLENIREAEQANISRIIHDQLGQSLTSLKFDLGTLVDQTENDSKENKKLAAMMEMVSQIIKNVQRISSELRPPALDELGLAAALEWYCEDFMERTGLRMHLELDEVQTDNINKNLVLYRILQESLTNVIRHADAGNVWIKLRIIGEDILLTIKDDGIGITPDKIHSIKSLGILGMFERIRQYGGTLEITNPDKKGTEVKVRLSIK